MVSQLLFSTHLTMKKMVNFHSERFHRLLTQFIPTSTKLTDKPRQKKGQVYFIGSGSGDPELLTLKAYRILQHADVILVDWLVDSEVKRYFPAEAEIIFVGKKQGRHSMAQAQICQLLTKQALQGKTVVRLKGGDPSIFGRLAEETQAMAEHNIPFAIVPGVTAASACGAYTGISLTDRECAQSVQFVTAHFKDEQQQANWSQLAQSEQTLVFYMGLSRVESIAQQLISHGMRADMPIAVIDKGTLAEQQLCCKTLQTISAERDLTGFTGPALVIVGEVVKYRQNVDLGMLHAEHFAHAMELRHA